MCGTLLHYEQGLKDLRKYGDLLLEFIEKMTHLRHIFFHVVLFIDVVLLCV